MDDFEVRKAKYVRNQCPFTEELTQQITKAVHKTIAEFPDSWPSKILIGRRMAMGTYYGMPDLKGFADGFGNCIPVELIDASVIIVEHRKLED
jgi:hypothetical protein